MLQLNQATQYKVLTVNASCYACRGSGQRMGASSWPVSKGRFCRKFCKASAVQFHTPELELREQVLHESRLFDMLTVK
jgi:hypothetical protein